MLTDVKQKKSDYEKMTNEELWIEYKKAGSLELKQELVLRYIYIVRNIAIQMRDVYVSFTQLDDIINEGVITVMNAIDKFDLSMNVKFETFVSKRIRGMIIDIARKQNWVSRLVRKDAREIDEATTYLYGRNGKMPTSRETAEYLNMPIEKYERVLSKSNLFYILSLDMLMEENRESRPTVQLPSSNEKEQPEESYLGNEYMEILADGIRSLKENEQMVISLYYKEEMSAKNIAKILGVSEPRISQIHSNAIRKLRLYIEEKTK